MNTVYQCKYKIKEGEGQSHVRGIYQPFPLQKTHQNYTTNMRLTLIANSGKFMMLAYL